MKRIIEVSKSVYERAKEGGIKNPQDCELLIAALADSEPYSEKHTYSADEVLSIVERIIKRS